MSFKIAIAWETVIQASHGREAGCGTLPHNKANSAKFKKATKNHPTERSPTIICKEKLLMFVIQWHGAQHQYETLK